MESGPIARWAEQYGIPFLVCRSVLDPAEATVPFAEDRPLWLSALRHPAATVKLAQGSALAGRRLGEGIGALLDLLEETR
jgi:hypothetical protein